MTFPTLLLSFLIALMYAAIYHYVRNTNGWRLLLFMGLSCLGFIVGQSLGTWQGWTFLMLGAINLGMGSIGSFVFLYGGDWLSRIEVEKESKV
ncbi:MAG: hypothetical protein U0Z26_11615 [Anaerolineales bacterium]